MSRLLASAATLAPGRLGRVLDIAVAVLVLSALT